MRDKSHVKGVTIINHAIRIDLGLTLREYTVLDFIRVWHINNKKKSQAITYGDFWIATGLMNRNISRIYALMKDKGLLFKDVDGKVKTTKKWNIYFEDHSVSFESIWKIYKVGVKNKAWEAFNKSLKIDSFENIMAGVQRYLKFLEQTDQFPLHVSTFLYWKNKTWQSEFDASIYKKKEIIQPPIINTGPASAWG